MGGDHDRRPRDFVEVGASAEGDPGDENVVETRREPLSDPPSQPGWSLWGDAEI